MLVGSGFYTPACVHAAIWETLVDGSSFNSISAFQNAWNYNYPWGTDHNGTARMNQTNVTVSGGVLTLTSSLTNSYEGTSSKPPYSTIRYNSGTFYLKQQITISSNYPLWDISGQFKVPTQTGTWPALWFTGVNSWPPESDIMEFKGTSGCSQNTYNGSWQAKVTTVSTAGSAWHTYRVVACLENSTNVDFHYYIDGVMESEQTTTTFVGSPCWLIIDYQMEGSSGTPGPAYTTYTYATNIVVSRLNNSGVGSGPVANGAYKLVAVNSGQVVDVGGQATANNSTVDQWPYNAGLNQQWILTHLGASQYSIIGRQSGRALQAAGAAVTNGAQMNIADFSKGAHQIWALAAASAGSYQLINVNSGKTMEVAGDSTNNFAPIDQWSWGNTTFPLINKFFLSGTNLVLQGTTGIPGITYLCLSSTNLTSPVASWSNVASVVFDQSGSFSTTNGIALASAQQFYKLQMQSTNGVANQQWWLQSP